MIGSDPDEPADDAPPVMWSPPGSGFEASPYSPAGRSQGLWRVARAGGRSSTWPRWARVAGVLVLASMVAPFAVAVVVTVVDVLR